MFASVWFCVLSWGVVTLCMAREGVFHRWRLDVLHQHDDIVLRVAFLLLSIERFDVRVGRAGPSRQRDP